jgi:predicted DCC family thiol-disulfide oxidoreductase YuxK
MHLNKHIAASDQQQAARLIAPLRDAVSPRSSSIQQRASSDQHPAILFDGHCSLCSNSIKLVKRLDWLHRFTFRDLNRREEIARDYPNLDEAKTLEEMHVIMPDGRQLAGFFAFREIAKQVPIGWLLWPLLYIPGVPYFGARIYRLIARHRRRAAVVCKAHDA